MAYSSRDFVKGGAVPLYLVIDKVIDKATYGPEGSEDDPSVYWVTFLPPGQEESSPLGEVATLAEGIRIAEQHWEAQRDPARS